MKRKQQQEPPLSESIERRLLHIHRHLTLYPATPDLLYYMLTEMDVFREEISLIRQMLPHGIISDELFELQIQVTSIESKIYDQLSEATELWRSQASILT